MAHHPIPHHHHRRRLVALAISLWLGSLVFAQAGAPESIAAGRLALTHKDISAAKASFQAAVTAEPNNAIANFLLAASSVAEVETKPEAQALLNKLGVTAAGRSVFHWKAKAPKHFAPNLTTDALENWEVASLRPVLAAADLNLSKITDPNFTITLATSETGLPAVTIDYGDVLMLRALANSAICSLYASESFDTNVNLKDIGNWLPTNVMTMQKVLAAYPKLLNLSTAPKITVMIAAFNTTVNVYTSASDFIRSRVDASDRLFMLDPEYAGQEAKLRTELSTIQLSFSGVAAFDSRTQVNASAFQTTPKSIRSLLPQYTNNHVKPGTTFPDVHFAGVLPDMTENRVEEYFGKVAKRLDVLFRHRDDPVDPVVRIGTPKANARVSYVSSDFVTVTGSATDNVGVTQVTVFPQHGAAVVANQNSTAKSVQWTATIPAVPGVNSIRVVAHDAQGNSSHSATVNFTFVKMAPLTLNVVGSGTVRTNPHATNQVELARPYTFTAMPSAQQIFGYWTYGTDSGDPYQFKDSTNPLTFAPDGALTLNAHFIPNPYATRAGTFTGVLSSYVYDPDTFQYVNRPVGSYTVSLTKTGAFTARFLVNGKTYVFTGKLDGQGQFSFAGKKNGRDVFAAFNLDFHSAIHNELSAIFGFGSQSFPEERYAGQTRGGVPVNFKAHYTATLSFPLQDPDFPDPSIPLQPDNLNGQGYLTISPDRSGMVKVIGALPDGSKFSASVAPQSYLYYDDFDPDTGEGISPHVDPMIQFYAPILPSGSSISAQIDIPADLTTAYNSVHWLHVANSGILFPDALEVDLLANLSGIAPPPAGHVLPPFDGAGFDAKITIFDSISGDPVLNQSFKLDAHNKVVLESPVQTGLKLTLDITSGAFSGTYPLSSGAHPPLRAFSGVLQPDSLSGGGFSLDDNGSGDVEVSIQSTP